jgi:hypothetical protein
MIRNATPGGSTASSPFAAAPAAATTTALTTTTSSTAPMIPVKLPSGQIVNVSTQAEVDALRAAVQPTQIVDLSKPAGSSSTTTLSSAGSLLDMGADALQAVGGFLAGSRYHRLLQDLQQARATLLDARDQLQVRSTTDPQTSGPMLLAMDAMITYQDAAISVLNAQITAVDMAAGGSTAKLVSKFMDGGFNGMNIGNGMGPALALGAGGIGLGLLLANHNNNSAPPRRR